MKLKEEITKRCENMTIRLKLIKMQTNNSKDFIKDTENVITDVYKILITDLNDCLAGKGKGYLILKYTKNKQNIKLIDGENYIADKVKIIINKKGEVIVISTSCTVFRAEEEGTFSVESFELSDKEEN